MYMYIYIYIYNTYTYTINIHIHIQCIYSIYNRHSNRHRQTCIINFLSMIYSFYKFKQFIKKKLNNYNSINR